jgi:hypothetical protein
MKVSQWRHKYFLPPQCPLRTPPPKRHHSQRLWFDFDRSDDRQVRLQGKGNKSMRLNVESTSPSRGSRRACFNCFTLRSLVKAYSLPRPSLASGPKNVTSFSPPSSYAIVLWRGRWVPEVTSGRELFSRVSAITELTLLTSSSAASLVSRKTLWGSIFLSSRSFTTCA